MSKSESHLGEEIVGRKESFDPVTFDAVGIQEEDGRRPLRAVLRAESLEVCGLLLDMHARGQKVVCYETYDARVWPYLGIQPSTAPSHRGGVEIQKDGTVLDFRGVEGRVNIMPPWNLHGFLLCGFRDFARRLPQPWPGTGYTRLCRA